MNALINLLLKIYFAVKEYSLESAIERLQNELLILKSKIMDGDYSAALIAREKLQELESLTQNQ